MGKLKDALLTQHELSAIQWRDPVFMPKAIALRNSHWHEDMPDLTGKALADAQRDFINEADDMPLWIQLELDLWEGKHGINEWTAWDVEGGKVS